MAAKTRSAPCVARDMLWDDPCLRFTDLSPAQPSARRQGLVWGAWPRGDLAHAAAMAGLDLAQVGAFDGLLSAIARSRPDIVFLGSGDAITHPREVLDAIDAARTTETLPVLAIAASTGLPDLPECLAPDCSVTEAFLVIRALLRRERPSALDGIRHAGAFTLDEARFQLAFDGRTAALNKTDICLLGPFFDLPGAVFDRLSLERLAFGGRHRKAGGRSVDACISRTRRAVRDQIGQDPLHAIRGQGYRLGAG